MKMVGITPCYRITLENGSYGVETYINADSKIQITFEDGNTLIGYIECVEYGTYPLKMTFYCVTDTKNAPT